MTELTIGERAAQAIKENAQKNGRSISKECIRIGFDPKTRNEWAAGRSNPGGYVLSLMANAGYDVIWILIEKKGEEFYGK